MQRMALEEFLRVYDLYDKGVDAITQDDAGRVRFVFDLFHCDDPQRDDEAKEYLLTATFRPQDVVVLEGELYHEEGGWLGKVLDLQEAPAPVRMGIEWWSLRLPGIVTSWTSLALLDGPIQAEETISDR